MKFFDKNKILLKFQSGFSKNHSTDFYLSYLTDKISNGFDSGLLTGIILIDLQKAFDTIDHQILLQKFPSFGFLNEVIDWFRSYLRSRKFHVNIHDKFSTTTELRWGVPQGSIIVSLLFLLFFNDMPQAVDCNLFFYADNICLLCQHKDLDQINKELTQIFVIHVTGLLITSSAFTLGRIKLNLSFSLSKTKRRTSEHQRYWR